jgi:CotH kinase protein
MRFLYWCLTLTLWASFSAYAQQAVVFTDSNLPILVLDTRGQVIPDDPKIGCRFRLIAHPNGQRNRLTDAPTGYDGWAGVEVRGSSSQAFPKLGYGVELWTDSVGNDQVDSALCGMPAEHDWVLQASYSDKTFLRNYLTYHLARQLGHWAARVVPCELVLNGQYQGIYLLMEKVKRGAQRVPVAKLTDTDIAGDRLTGGYIFKIDKTTGSGGSGWTSRFAPPQATQGQQIQFLYDYPKDDAIVPDQQRYLQAYVDSFEVALAGANFTNPQRGYSHFADPATFTDFLLLNEASRNVDGYRISTYLHKDRDSRPGGGRLRAGPVWDYDIAWHNADYCDGERVDGWAWQFNNVCGNDGMLVPFWWGRLLQDTTFRNATNCRWQTLRQPGQPLATATISHWLDSLAVVLDESQRRNFLAWPILGQYVWPNPSPIATSYAGEIAHLKSWIGARAAWLDTHTPGICRPLATAAPLLDVAATTLWPNPATTTATPRLTFGLTRPTTAYLIVRDATGQLILQGAAVTLGAGVRTLPVPGELRAGLYVVQLMTAEGVTVSRRLMIE